MKTLIGLVVLASLLSSGDAWADSTLTKPGPLSPMGYQQLSSLSSATGFTVPSSATIAVVVCTGQTVRWRDDGTSPTSSVGTELTVNTYFPYVGNLSLIKFIQESASATCDVAYYK